MARIAELAEARLVPRDRAPRPAGGSSSPGAGRDLFTTFPTWSPELVADLVVVAEESGPVVEERYLTVLYLAERTDGRVSP